GDPYEPYVIGGLKVPRYRVALFGILAYAGIYMVNKTYSSFQPKAPIKFENAQEEEFVKKYIKHAHEEAHKPAFVRQSYAGPSGL
ncbi:hypothetical protein BC829DRAFT_363014, partial [Chytridium lagenaria]